MAWKVIKQPRGGRDYFLAQWVPKIGGSKRSAVVLGYLNEEIKARGFTFDPDDPEQMAKVDRIFDRIGKTGIELDKQEVLYPTASTLTLTHRLREADPHGVLPDGQIVEICKGLPTGWPGAEVTAPVVLPAAPVAPSKALRPEGEMPLRRYVAEVWAPIRKAQESTWEREDWWWEQRILPVLGDVRLCDLDTDRWTAFLASLRHVKGPKVGQLLSGTSRRLCQTAYRTALTHAEEQGWIEVHRFRDIPGSTQRALPEPEPMHMDEVATFLKSTAEPVHRALFATQIGQGLRPGEVILVRWEDVHWAQGMIFIRGEKNRLAKGTVPLAPLTRRELGAYWESLGSPVQGPAFTRTRGEGAFAGFPRKAFQNAAKASKLNDGRVRKLFPNVDRHTFATIAAESGIDRAFAKLMMRHSKESSVMEEAYVRVSRDAAANAMKEWGKAK